MKSKETEKIKDLHKNTNLPNNKRLTTNQGVKVNDTNNSLSASERGPSLLEDFILREKITHFDHERIPERIVHARGSGAHGYFELYESQQKYTKAEIFTDTNRKTPVFVRFSTVAGSKGSVDLARDVRGFAVKFYTQEGIFDLVGNNMPIFFIQDAMKFPDLIHSVKPEPNREIPQAASAHDTFYDFISLTTETLHNHIWLMSDRAIPRSFRMMEGFGIHTFRFVNVKGESHFVKFHWKPKLGVKSVTWDEAVKIHGADPDFHRRDLWDAIEAGNYPEWELGIQVIPEKDENKFDFDLLDPTKLIPEEMVPVKRIGKLVLNRNPSNFFAETEQVAFHPGHLVPGIDFTNDPLLQGRLFSYTDTQLSRLGSPNFHEIPINRPINEVHNNQRDAHMRMTINEGKTAYFPNSIGGGCPYLSKIAEGGFSHYEERVDGKKIRSRSESFNDHFSQPALFYRSLETWEKEHVINGYAFELGKCTYEHIKLRMLWLLEQINNQLAERVAEQLGLEIPKDIDHPINQAIGANADINKQQPPKKKNYLDTSKALSQTFLASDDIATCKIAILVANGFNGDDYVELRKLLEEKNATVALIAPHGGKIICNKKNQYDVDAFLSTTESVLYDALYVPGGKEAIKTLMEEAKAIKFINETLKHCKTIGTADEGEELLDQTYVKLFKDDEAILINKNVQVFIKALSKHRNWKREKEAINIPV